MATMWVFISQRQVVGPHGDTRDALENSYVEFLERNGVLPLPVPNALRDPASYLKASRPIDGVVLTGGNDVCPAEYGEKALRETDVSPARDRTERALLDLAVRRRIPVLAICRGMQFLNVYFGGRLVQDVSRQLRRKGHPPAKDHAVDFVEERMSRFLGRPEAEVNSYHNQAVIAEGVAPLLKPFAIEREEGIIEGLFHPALPIAGVQFHPERRPQEDPVSLCLIEAFRGRKLYWGKD
ncbi:MAG: gamma-glutamyl-gamma-aminobutyrate hydrolase family protein [Candidatus Tectomicrobia bacterium]|uniref:Gamma-glutamyl-gamma-aminobutyrate hydrolase family protein n=1 Tax=Tectimicrobiota bacterium TaxID=2528274 RepID=A0A932HX43_UNCTE|nr:gamma-glutamyl-gamma-aminobutyrate hydrolase family protein [Candidatus Tectomicrobia bacterium]